MDIATRYQPRVRAQSYLDRERNAMPNDDDAGEASEPQQTRRKFQRTTPVVTTALNNDADTFRKPSLPASAMRPTTLDRRPSLNQSHQRRRSTLRENVRVPSGPREFPSPGKRLGSTTSITMTPSPNDNGSNATNLSRSFLPATRNEPFYSNSNNSASRMAPPSQHPRFSFGGNLSHSVSNTNASDTDSPTTPAERAQDGFDFVPTMSFDDFQTSVIDPNHWSSPLLTEFPTVSGGRALPKEPVEQSVSTRQRDGGDVMARSNGFASSTMARPGLLSSRRQQSDEGGVSTGEEQTSTVGRTPSFRSRRTSAATSAFRQASGQPASTSQPVQTSNSQPNLSYRTRRQSTLPSTASTQPPLPSAAARPPRKSVGPGFITSMMGSEGRKGSLAAPHIATEPTSPSKPGLARTNSLSNAARRTTLQPTNSAGPDLPRLSTLTATTQSRANKVKSLQPPPRQQSQDPDTPNARPVSKGNPNRAHTPSSSGNNKRQSTMSGRASGLGARTISPTDARRLKRMSMMQAPPMPTAAIPKGSPTPQDELITNPWTGQLSNGSKPEIPRLTQPSPSLIPRKSSTSTPTSARASPDGRYFSLGVSGINGGGGGGASVLSSKSSYQSLISNSAASGSRLPTPKPRQTHSSAAQYGDGNQEFVPPVPAIPKAFESPHEHDQPFFRSSLKSSQSTYFPAQEQHSSFGFDNETMPPRGSMDLQLPPMGTPRKRSGEMTRPNHKRTSTIGAPGTLKPTSRPEPDPAGRKNNNLQPLRLPPLNLMPLTMPSIHRPATTTANTGSNALPRPSNELDSRENFMSSMQTPEPGYKRNTKTPSTPMTASKATFWRRHDDNKDMKLRSSSSHYALRDLTGGDPPALATRFFDDSDAETPANNVGMNLFGIPIPGTGHSKARHQAITPFSSGSLPKGSGEWTRQQLRARPSLEYQDEYDLGSYTENLQLMNAKPMGPRPRVPSQPVALLDKTGTPSSVESGNFEVPSSDAAVTEKRKESTGGGLRRKLSLGWRRSSSKAANHAENANKSSPIQQPPSMDFGSEKGSRLQKKSNGSETMPPPKLPASAAANIQQSAETNSPSLPRMSLEERANRRKSTLPTVQPQGHSHGAAAAATSGSDAESSTIAGPKTRSLHSEHPQAVPQPNSRVIAGTTRQQLPIGKPTTVASRGHKPTASTLNALVKDKDDLAADEEMRKLSQKRRDVDAAARESEALEARAVPRSPMSPDQALHDRSCALNIFERGEVADYKKDGVFFTGNKGCRKIIGALGNNDASLSSDKAKDVGTDKTGNFGYDDERGDYNIVMGDHLAYRYEVVDLLGKGSFGQVVRCIDHKDGGVVAVKIIRNKKRFHQQALVEVGILGRLSEWDPEGANATLSITRSFYFRSHLCIVTPCLSINLYEFIRAHNFTGFSLPLIRRFSRQLLACLVLLQTKRIIHCDLKPENILLCSARAADVRVIDFGSSCREEEKVYTYIQSRFYRSPEVILGSSYGLGIDMWSLGCILAELWTGYPLFPGENEQEQLACIMEIFGPPDRHLVERCTRKKLFFDSVGKPRVTVSSKGRRRRPSSKTLAQALKTDDEAFLDFVARCLRWDPERRLKPAEAVAHPFITNGAMRPGIPDEARRAAGARVRSSQQTASPVKRATVTGPAGGAKEGNAFAQLASSASSSTPTTNTSASTAAAPTTPAAVKRGLGVTDSPQTALRGANASASAAGGSQGSPVKALPPSLGVANRRHSYLATNPATTGAGSKRTSNGTVLSSGLGQQQRFASGTLPTSAGAGAPGGGVSLAQMAARESMGASANAVAGVGVTQRGGSQAARWRG